MNSFLHYKSQFASSSPCIAIGKSVRASLELYAQRQGHFRLPQISNSENQRNWWKIFKNFRGSSSFITHKTSLTKKYGILIFSRLLRPDFLTFWVFLSFFSKMTTPLTSGALLKICQGGNVDNPVLQVKLWLFKVFLKDIGF